MEAEAPNGSLHLCPFLFDFSLRFHLDFGMTHLLIHAASQMNPQNTLLSKSSQTQKATCFGFHFYGIQEKVRGRQAPG